MPCEPGTGELAFMGDDIVADQVDERDLVGCAVIDLLQQFDELDLALALAADANDLASAGIEASEQVESASASVFVLDVDRNAARQRRSVGRRPRTWLDRGFLVEREDALVGFERPRVKLAQIENGLAERRIPRHLRAQPVVDAPGLELLRLQKPLH